MICLTRKQTKNLSEIIGVFLFHLSSSDFNPLDYVIWGALQNKINATSQVNIGSRKTAFEEEWNEMSQIFLKTCKSFWR